MRAHHTARPGEPRLRIVFADTSFALGVPVCPTFGDIADWVEDIARLHDSHPLSIDIRFGAQAAPRRGARLTSMGALDHGGLDESHAVAMSGQNPFAPDA
jgi:hypothetical protein